MARNGSGTYSLPAGNPVVSGTPITASWANSTLADIAGELTNSFDRQGRGGALANLPMGGFKFTGLAAGSVAGDSIRYEQALNQDTATVASAATTDIATPLASRISITGTTTVTSFGTGAAAGVTKILTFTGNLTLTHSASLICPNGVNLAVLAGQSLIVLSEASNVWRVLAAPNTLTVRLNDLASATGSSTLANGDNPITWGWVPTTNGRKAFRISSSSSVGTGHIGLEVDVSRNHDSVLDLRTEGALIARFTPFDIQLTPAQGDAGNGGVGRSITIAASRGEPSTSSRNGGSVTITAGQSGATGSGGSITVQPGTGSPAGSIILRNAGDTLRLRLDSTVPVISSGGGAGATIRGIDNFFEVTFGTGSPTSVVVGFSAAKGAAPMALVSGSQSAQIVHVTTSTTGVTISSNTAFNSGTKVTCMVIEAN